VKITHAVLVVLACSAPIAGAKLPPPTPEEMAAREQRAAQEKAQLEREKALLEQAQDRVAELYRRARPAPAGGASDTNMPNTVHQLPGDAGPRGGQKQSAEAHSAPAK